MKVTGLAYVNLEPDNGGIILDISEGGLCFQSTAPVKRTETIRFWFSYKGQRAESGRGMDRVETSGVSRLIEVGSELAWTDESQKRGGLRFNNLSDTAREQIRDWIRQPALVHVNQGAPGLFPSVRISSTNFARVASARVEVLVRRVQSAGLWKGYFGGVVTGIVASGFLVSMISLLTHTHAVGDSLIQLGERLGGRTWSQPISPSTEASSVEAPTDLTLGERAASSPESESKSKSESRAAAPPDLEPGPAAEAPKQASRPEKLFSKGTLPTVDKPAEMKLEATNSKVSSTAKTVSPSFSAPKVTAPTARGANTDVSRLSAPVVAAPAVSDFSASALRAPAPEAGLANSFGGLHIEPSKVDGAAMGSEKYLEIGKFKERILADGATSRLSRLGFPATVVQRSRFFAKSYQVLVGPYATDPEAETVHKDLAARGFTPRSYERGKRDFFLPAGLQMNGKRLPAGFCAVSWESYNPDAIVKFDNNKDISVTVQGRWVKQVNKFPQDAVGYEKNKDGIRTLLEIRFGGMAQTLVFSAARN
jgi:hypothetical protein